MPAGRAKRLGRSRRGGLSRPLGPPVEPSAHAVPPRVESGPPENRGSGVGMASRPTGKTPVGAQHGRIAWSGARGAGTPDRQPPPRRRCRSGSCPTRTCCCSRRRHRCHRRFLVWELQVVLSVQSAGGPAVATDAGSRSTGRRCTCSTGTGCSPCRWCPARGEADVRRGSCRSGTGCRRCRPVAAVRDLADSAEADQPRGARGPAGATERSPVGTRRCSGGGRWQPPLGRAPTAAAGWSTRRHRRRHRGGAGHDESNPLRSRRRGDRFGTPGLRR